MLSSVLLPLPEGPRTATNEPCGTAKSIPFNAWTSSAPMRYFLTTLFNTTAGLFIIGLKKWASGAKMRDAPLEEKAHHRFVKLWTSERMPFYAQKIDNGILYWHVNCQRHG